MKFALKADGYKGSLISGWMKDELVPEKEADFILCVGWKKFIRDNLDKHIVLHDSILPSYKGHCPTVTALIEKEGVIGVTAFKPNLEIDGGQIITCSTKRVKYPIKIKDAYELQFCNYKKCINMIRNGTWTVPLRREESWSTWRGPLDYYVNWSWSADKIARFINAVGPPYSGALIFEGSQRVFESEVIPSPRIINPIPGKVFRIEDGSPVVICGEKSLLKLPEVKSKRLKDVFRCPV